MLGVDTIVSDSLKIYGHVGAELFSDRIVHENLYMPVCITYNLYIQTFILHREKPAKLKTNSYKICFPYILSRKLSKFE